MTSKENCISVTDHEFVEYCSDLATKGGILDEFLRNEMISFFKNLERWGVTFKIKDNHNTLILYGAAKINTDPVSLAVIYKNKHILTDLCLHKANTDHALKYLKGLAQIVGGSVNPTGQVGGYSVKMSNSENAPTPMISNFMGKWDQWTKIIMEYLDETSASTL